MTVTFGGPANIRELWLMPCPRIAHSAALITGDLDGAGISGLTNRNRSKIHWNHQEIGTDSLLFCCALAFCSQGCPVENAALDAVVESGHLHNRFSTDADNSSLCGCIMKDKISDGGTRFFLRDAMYRRGLRLIAIARRVHLDMVHT